MSRSIVQFSPMNEGESIRTLGSMDEPLPTHTPGRSSKPATSAWTLPSRMSSWALRYAAVVPTSSQYPSATYPYSGSPASSAAGNTSPEKSTERPSGMRSKISVSST